LIILFKTSEPDFYADYVSARNIVYSAGRKKKSEKND
jgi:hypothetical protein